MRQIAFAISIVALIGIGTSSAIAQPGYTQPSYPQPGQPAALAPPRVVIPQAAVPPSQVPTQFPTNQFPASGVAPPGTFGAQAAAAGPIDVRLNLEPRR